MHLARFALDEGLRYFGVEGGAKVVAQVGEKPARISLASKGSPA